MTAKLAQARRDLFESEQSVGARLADGLDVVEAQTVVREMESEVRALESAVAILWQRKEDAIESVKLQAQAADRAQEQADLTTLYELACAICRWMDSGREVFVRYADQRKKVIAHGNLGVNARLNDANLSFTSFLFKVVRGMAGCVNSYAVFQTDPKWSQPWSELHPRPEIVHEPRIEPPVEQPRKGWQAQG
jgi:hypothetical protein